MVGLPGAGKSHSGKLLAGRLGWNFLDLDRLIEDELNKTVGDIFEDHGEEIFRQMETEVLHKTSNMSNTVISCGGGTPVWADNMNWMRRHGLIVYLNPSIDTIVPRILKNEKKRPLFRGLKEGQLRKKLQEFVEKRGEYYSQANIVWNKDEPGELFYKSVNQLLSLYSAPF